MSDDVYRRNIGAVALTALQDGHARWAPGDILRPEVEADFAPYQHLIDDDGMMQLSMTVYLLESQGVRVLADSGIADQPMGRHDMDVHSQLPRLLDEEGIDPASIDFVVHTHLHFDHVGWNTRAEGDGWVPMFPNAKHIIQRPDWEHWVLTDRGFPGPVLERSIRPLEEASMIELVEGYRALAPEISVVAAYGHTPGHQVLRIASEGEAAYILGDSCHIAMQVCETGWSDRADVDHEQGDRSRAAIMERVDDEGALVIGGHFPFPGLGRRVPRDGGYMYEPLED